MQALAFARNASVRGLAERTVPTRLKAAASRAWDGGRGWINSSVLRSRKRAAREIEQALKLTGGDFNGY